jgi:hypothetical protein
VWCGWWSKRPRSERVAGAEECGQQTFHDLEVAGLHREHEWGLASIILRIDRGAGAHQEFHDLGATAVGGVVERGAYPQSVVESRILR